MLKSSTILQGHFYDLKISKAWNGSIIALHYYIAHYKHGAAGKKIPLSFLNFQLDSHIFKIGAAVMNKTDN